MTAPITAIAYTLDTTTHAFTVSATFTYPDATTQAFSLALQGFQYDLYLLDVQTLKPSEWITGCGLTPTQLTTWIAAQPTTLTYQDVETYIIANTGPATPADVARILCKANYPLLWSGPPQVTPASGTAPDITS